MLHYRHNNFYALATPSSKNQRQRKQMTNKETDATCSTHLKKRQEMRDQKTKAQIKKIR